MDRPAIFAACTAMRHDTADWLETLADDQLDAPSLCAGWAVRGVAGHLICAATAPLRTVLVQTLRSGLSPDRAMVVLGDALGAHPGPELAATLRAAADVELDMPFVGAHGPLADLVVHNADMRVPVGASWAPEHEVTAEALDFVAKGAPGFTPKKRLRGLRIVPSDVDAAYGDGLEVTGPAYDLLLALCGRRVGLDRLSGSGADVLASRI